MESDVQTHWLGADSILYATAHRPWPLPTGPWVMTQTWNDLLFAHWPVDPQVMRALVPETLTLDLYEGSAWIKNLRPPGLPAIPVISQFPELNVRTYVTVGGKPGVYFFSLDAANLSAVWGARMFYRLPYWHAAMKIKGKPANVSSWSEGECEWVHYSSKRIHGPQAGNAMPEFRAAYRPVLPARTAKPGSLEEFLSERYCLYSVSPRGRTYRADIHHLPWPLQAAEVEIEINTMAEPLRLALPNSPALANFSRLLKVLVWAPERLA
jgi:uncharacterized protein YqjF (DUF2071 family)